MLKLKPRERDSHKGTYGHVLIVGGSRGKSGAPLLAGLGASAGGAGLVTVAVPESIQPVVAASRASLMTLGLRETSRGTIAFPALRAIREMLPGIDAVVAGPGLSTEEDAAAFLFAILAHIRGPVVLDADALNVLALRGPPSGLPGGAVLTPHPGEAGRLLGRSAAEVQAARSEAAKAIAVRYGAVVVLKGHGTIVCDGRRVHVNATGGPALAKGGSGDVLGGIVAALVCEGLSSFDAACAAVHVHGDAGDRAARIAGERSVTPELLLEHVPAALAALA